MSDVRVTFSPNTSAVAISPTGYQYPIKAVNRWLFRLAFSAPFALIAAWSTLAPTADPQTTLVLPNAQLASGFHQLQLISVSELDQIFPPIPNFISALVSGNALALGLIGSAVGGVFLTAVMRRMRVAGFRRSLIVLALFALGANPLFAYNAVGNLSSM